jgi:pimeloyl-ACP methyl ester carboxylesterase
MSRIAGEKPVRIPLGSVTLEGDLAVPAHAPGIVVFAHGSGSSRHSSRNRFVAGVLHESGIATLLFDLLTAREEAEERDTAHLRFDIGLLADRLIGATGWLTRQPTTRELPIGYFGASTGAAAALVAAAHERERVATVVSRGGRPDLAGSALRRVHVPTLLIVGGHDSGVIELNQRALQQIAAPDKQLVIVPRATHLFEEPGALEEVAQLAADWFVRHLSHSPSATR